jgi:hypothetical protein
MEPLVGLEPRPHKETSVVSLAVTIVVGGENSGPLSSESRSELPRCQVAGPCTHK